MRAINETGYSDRKINGGYFSSAREMHSGSRIAEILNTSLLNTESAIGKYLIMICRLRRFLPWKARKMKRVRWLERCVNGVKEIAELVPRFS